MGSFTKPIVWREKERLDDRIADCLTIILRTRGCRWDSCYMCGYTNDAYPATRDELIQQIDMALEEGGAEVVKIFTSGSFFDDAEVPMEVRAYLRDRIRDMGAKKLIVESRPEFVEKERLDDFKGVNLEVGIGLETADDEIRELCINKGFSFEDFVRATETLKEMGFRAKCYLLLKPPFLSEREAIEDAVKSIKAVKNYADVVSLNLTNVQKGTLVEKLWRAKLYRPPWLWSAVEVLKKAKDVGVEILCDPVAAGKKRGPHNCGKCDADVSKAIREFSLTQDAKKLEDIKCECILKWGKVLELESYSRIPLL
ncbi:MULTISPECIES: archaeosine biosynthesis radical SAM protein RaSEA [unclassified Archaeoglobus]|jgi:hypothetical protein|uniref:archaeosine biosynthesis radical SAM protein RaSEA n=1 Tax=unclassified Archaeoglobus TaxID=2643606 RepID=UPI0025BAC7BB|nr:MULTISPECIES: archaeosine biosynthesis radical SAM protein RaSEA [unclassified Archaeoglobus]